MQDRRAHRIFLSARARDAIASQLLGQTLRLPSLNRMHRHACAGNLRRGLCRLFAIRAINVGMQTGDGAAAVGISATRAVVSSIVLIVLVDGIFAYISYKTGF